MELAVIDIGSNTIIMTVYYSSKGKLKEVYTKSEHTGLINYIENGALSDKGIRILSDTVADLAAEAGRKKCFYVFPFATASLRRASNSAEIIERVKTETGYQIDLLDGEDEAAFSFSGLTKTMKGQLAKSGLMADLGGGSTETVAFEDDHPVDSASSGIGVLALYNRFVSGILPAKGEIKDIRKFCYAEFKKLAFIKGCGETVYMIGGTARAIAKLHAALSSRPFTLPYTLNKAELDGLLERLVSKEDKNIKITAIEQIPSRIHTVCPGICAISELLHASGAEKIVVTSASVREGYALYAAKLNNIG